MRIRRQKRGQRSRGAITVELCIGAFFLIIMTALAIDITLLMLGYETNDRACRNACRSAAQQTTSTKAQAAAAAILSTVAVDGTFLKKPTLSLSGSDWAYQDYNGNPTAGNPFVRVTSTMQVRTPVPLYFFGVAKFGDADNDKKGDLWTFRKTYTFPIVTFNLVI
ncbi:MAG: hypothetical protein K2X29_07035 [Candidatus Obscuribacterales bacterium]|nr:hypothetical protein [Candidatus Obscuribacterales bacterium]